MPRGESKHDGSFTYYLGASSYHSPSDTCFQLLLLVSVLIILNLIIMLVKLVLWIIAWVIGFTAKLVSWVISFPSWVISTSCFGFDSDSSLLANLFQLSLCGYRTVIGIVLIYAVMSIIWRYLNRPSKLGDLISWVNYKLK